MLYSDPSTTHQLLDGSEIMAKQDAEKREQPRDNLELASANLLV